MKNLIQRLSGGEYKIISRKMEDILLTGAATVFSATYTIGSGFGTYSLWHNAPTKWDYAGVCLFAYITGMLGSITASGVVEIWQKAKEN